MSEHCVEQLKKFEEILKRDNSVSIHDQNIRVLISELKGLKFSKA